MPIPEQAPRQELGSIAVLIPAWQPEARLVSLVERLAEFRFAAVILVDDGSTSDAAEIFTRLKELPQVHVVRHATNLGKGRALKTGLNFAATELGGIRGIVTADADGQHRVEDIVRVAEALAHSGGRAVLGVRSFGSDAPLRSRYGNLITRYIFWFLAGRKVVDTQTGLRGFPSALIPRLLLLGGERYEYEMNVLAYLCRDVHSLVEVPIATIYIDQNRSSHFDPIRDSMRIYFILLRFYTSSLIATGIDFIGFSVTFAATHDILISMIVGRLSSIANFLLNRRFVFHSDTSITGSIWKYYLAVGILAAVAFEAIQGLVIHLGWNVFLAKAVTETTLSLASFAVQRTFVFPIREEA